MLSNEKWFGAEAGFYPQTIDQSLRFDGSTSKLEKTPSSDGNRKKWTSSWWVKRSKLGALQYMWSGASYSGNDGIAAIYFNSDDKIHMYFDSSGASPYGAINNRLYRDTTNWYHFVWAVDAENTVAKLWVNGVEETVGITPPNFSYGMNKASTKMAFGIASWGGSPNFNGYCAEFVHLDGQYLDETSFGEFKNGVWIPKDINAQGFTFGTNGFYLPFSDSSNIGYDYQTSDRSGTTNDYTATGLASTDVVLDSPTNNFATALGAGLAEPQDYQSYYQPTSSEGNLKVTGSSSGWSNGSSNFGMTSGKWYAEVIVNSWVASNYVRIGLRARPARSPDEYFVLGNGTGQLDSTARNGRLPSFTTGDVIQFALDLENNAFYLGKNGIWGNSATEAEIEAGTTTNAWASGSEVPTGDGHAYFFYAQPHSTGTTITWNFGQDSSFAGAKTAQGNSDSGGGTTDFYYTPPTGFLACNSVNLPDTTLSPNQSEQATDYFNTRLYTGDGQTTQSITGVGFQPDWLWIKERSSTSDHVLLDSSRGASKFLVTSDANGTQAESTATSVHQSFDSDGFTVGLSGATNQNNETYVSWNWKANGGTTSSNTDGTITSTVQANTDAGFSIVTYTGTGSAGTIGHGLGKTPAVLITKNRSDGGEHSLWVWWHGARTGGFASDANYLYLNTTSPGGTSSGGVFYNGTQINTTTYGLLSGTTGVNKSGDNYLCLAFAEIEGYSKMGTYTGNGSADGTFVYTGFRPSFIMTKRTDTTGNWLIIDNKRDVDNVAHHRIIPNKVNVEATSVVATLDILSNGFKRRDNNTDVNANGGTYIYIAFGDGNTAKFGNSR